MKGRVIAFHDDPGHAALLVDGRLEDLLLASPQDTRAPMPDDIWMAKLDRKLPNQNAAFVRFGAYQGYLRDLRGTNGQSTLPVRVSGMAEQGKAIPVDRRVLIKGRALILTPGAPGVNISRQIRDADLREALAAAIVAPDPDTGVIVRSAARDIPQDIILAERDALLALLAALPGTPVGQAAILVSPDAQALREWTADWPDMIAVSDQGARRRAGPDALALFGCDPDLQALLTPGEGDPFEHFGVWDEIENLRQPHVTLPSGGSMFVEATRAMVTVDVNTGDLSGDGAGMTASVEAARELPRQLRLRGLGGQVIIDFAPIKKMHRKKIEETLKAAFRKDPVSTTMAGWTPLGNFELQRKRERRPLAEVLGTT